MAAEESLKQLFQQEFARMVAVISHSFGLEHIELAEDIVGETFLVAAETWGIKGLPPNPPAWLYRVARQKAGYHFRRKKIFDAKIAPAMKAQQSLLAEPLDFSPRNIRDSQLQMLFAICDPAIASEAQIGLALRILCGFGIEEIAGAFLTNKETINKRLFRAKEKLRASRVAMEMPPDEALPTRLENVLRIIYLLFSEGYYSRSQDQILRKDLCIEALRLGLQLADYPATALPRTHALIALMCFHASRFDARQTEDAALVLYDQQDRERWDQGLIAQGMRYLELSARGDELSSYHLEAMIAYWHCVKEDTTEKWREILACYDRLLELHYSPGVALNRIFALYKARGRGAALAAAEALRLEDDHFYFLLLGELYTGFDNGKAKLNYQQAYTLAKTQTEKEGIQFKLAALIKNI
jgi:predicted RNA polymerase sigma factor